MSDAAHNRTVDGTRTGIQQRVKLECEREQQEQLLLSVIPAYIAAEVCADGRRLHTHILLNDFNSIFTFFSGDGRHMTTIMLMMTDEHWSSTM